MIAGHREDAVLHREPLGGTAEARGRHEHCRVGREVHSPTIGPCRQGRSSFAALKTTFSPPPPRVYSSSDGLGERDHDGVDLALADIGERTVAQSFPVSCSLSHSRPRWWIDEGSCPK
jgi:hypothetical protein